MFTITVEGIPATQGSKTLYRGRMVESSKKLPAWRKAVMGAAFAELIRSSVSAPFDEPLKLTAFIFLPRPAKPKWDRLPASKPDLDKLVRAICDALTLAGVIRDDALIVELQVKKLWAGEVAAGAQISLTKSL
jgi:crossover junction endodeoxyribonuclease RusA